MDLNEVFATMDHPKEKKVTPTMPHYYGDMVRKLFLIAACAMLFTLPFFTTYIPVTIWTALLIILGLSIFSGLTNPKVFILAILDMVIAIVALLLFGYNAIDAYLRYGITEMYFWLNEVLGLLFLISLYLSVKTVRGFVVNHKEGSVV